MYLKNISVLLFYCFSFIFCAEQSNVIQEINQNIKHADTYYWLSRARDNEVTDVNKAIFYFEKAQNQLKGVEKSPEVIELDQKIQKGLNTLRVQKEVATSLMLYFINFCQRMGICPETFCNFREIVISSNSI